MIIKEKYLIVNELVFCKYSRNKSKRNKPNYTKMNKFVFLIFIAHFVFNNVYSFPNFVSIKLLNYGRKKGDGK